MRGGRCLGSLPEGLLRGLIDSFIDFRDRSMLLVNEIEVIMAFF